MIDNCADDWRIAMTWQRITQIGMELVICAVHPIPGEYYFLWTTKLSNHGGKIGSQWVPVDVTLSLPMFLRLYLICRYLFQDSGRKLGIFDIEEGSLNFFHEVNKQRILILGNSSFRDFHCSVENELLLDITWKAHR